MKINQNILRSLLLIIVLLKFTLNVNAQRDTLSLRYVTSKLAIEVHFADSGHYFNLKQDDTLLFCSGYSDGSVDSIVEVALPDKKAGFIMRAIYCDGTEYSLLTVDKHNSVLVKQLFEVFAGGECDKEKAIELSILDLNKDGYPELYFYFEKKKQKLIPGACSAKIDLKTFLSKNQLKP